MPIISKEIIIGAPREKIFSFVINQVTSCGFGLA